VRSSRVKVGDKERGKGYGQDTGRMDYSGGGGHGKPGAMANWGPWQTGGHGKPGAMANRGRERAGVRTRLSRELGRDSPGSSFVITTDTPDTARAVGKNSV